MSKDDNIPNAVERATTQVTDGCRGIGFWAGNDRNELRIRLPIIPFLDMTSEIDHNQVKRFWDENAENRTRLAKADYNFYRNYLNMPSFFVMLPEVKGLSELDIGCREGHNTWLLADAGAGIGGFA